MTLKWMGAIFVVLGCGGVGLALRAEHCRQEKQLRQLIAALDYMQCELQYRLTPLPELCRMTGAQVNGSLGQLFIQLARELESRLNPDVYHCINAVLDKGQGLSEGTCGILRTLGRSLGRFHLEGQLMGLENTRHQCRDDLEALTANREVRLRSYQTLSLCAGAALAILFL